MTRAKTAAIAAVTLIAAGALAATVIGGQDGGGQTPGNPPPPGFEPIVKTDRVAGRDGRPGGRPSTGKAPQVFYHETRAPMTVPMGPGGETIEKCPKGSVATNGYWYIKDTWTGFGLSDQGSSPAGFRRWAFYWDNVSGADIQGLILGMVCDRDG